MPIAGKNNYNSSLQEEISVPEKTVSQENPPKQLPESSPESPTKVSAPTITKTEVPPPPDHVDKVNSLPDTNGQSYSEDSGVTTAPTVPQQKEAQKPNVQPEPEDLAVATATCSECTKIIKDFYEHLDQQTYLKELGLQEKSEVHFTRLLQKLLNNPPVVSGETNDLYTILQNTAHFFRIIGKDNIMILKGILDREKDQFEAILAHFYKLLHTPNCTVNNFSLTIPEKSLYEYAGFFLNTMGGRLYLFRRDSMSRMVVSYYSILLIDKANRDKQNIHGIKIKVAIDLLINELETTTNPLQLKDTYLDNLYDLKEFYQ